MELKWYQKSLWATIISFFIPGLVHILTGEPEKKTGWTLFIIWIIACIVGVGLGGLVVGIVGAVMGYKLSERLGGA